MTLYKLVGNNLIPKAFVNNEFWRKLRTKFTNAGQYAKITRSTRTRKSTGAKLPLPKPTSIEEQSGQSVASPGQKTPSQTECSAVHLTPNSTPVKKIPSLQNKGKGKGKGKRSSQSTIQSIPRDHPSSEDFVVEVSPRAKRVDVINKTFYYYLKRNGMTPAMLGNKE